MPDLDLEAIEQRAEAAMPGPWTYEMDFLLQRNRIIDSEGVVVAFGNAAITERTSAFIAAARADVPALIAEVRRLRAALQEAADNELREHGYRVVRRERH